MTCCSLSGAQSDENETGIQFVRGIQKIIGRGNDGPTTVLDSTLPLMAVQAASKNLRLLDETLEQKLPPVRSDEIRFRQVLLNLLSNPAKFTFKGQVVVRAVENKPAGHLRNRD